jgi:hypothetical protein
MAKIESENANDPEIKKQEREGTTIQSCNEHIPKERLKWWCPMETKTVIPSVWI